jgi:hypothetical protein
MVRREKKDGQKNSGQKRVRIEWELPFSLSPSKIPET